MSADGMSDIAEHVSPMPFDATLERLIATIARAGLTLFGRIDHQAGSAECWAGDAAGDGAHLWACERWHAGDGGDAPCRP